ncbi:hypothetical protein AS189_04895 [Arthrobacter alpinus]|uniref:Uncharacterized protein n=1 Tax=Arthrobacter alpinus TaxID=656366 RepID=A0A0S2LX05_9MICC|nr:hypothetical protein AS189_04895 [Arthrobacter alpinus]
MHEPHLVLGKAGAALEAALGTLTRRAREVLRLTRLLDPGEAQTVSGRYSITRKHLKPQPLPGHKRQPRIAVVRGEGQRRPLRGPRHAADQPTQLRHDG